MDIGSLQKTAVYRDEREYAFQGQVDGRGSRHAS